MVHECKSITKPPLAISAGNEHNNYHEYRTSEDETLANAYMSQLQMVNKIFSIVKKIALSIRLFSENFN